MCEFLFLVLEIKHYINSSLLSVIVRVSIVLKRTVVVDND